MVWFMHMEQTDCLKIKHVRNGREYKLPELPYFSVDGYCPRLIQFMTSLAALAQAHVLTVP